MLQDIGRSAQGLVVRARWAVDQWPEGWQNHEVHGAALYRTGDYQEAVRELEAAIKLRNGTRSMPATIFSSHFLTLAHHKLGNQKEAARWQSQAVLPKDANWEDAMIDRYLRREVEAEIKRQ